MLGLSAVCAGLAVSLVRDYAQEVRAQVGPLVPVLVARSEIARGKTVTPANASHYISERRVPERFVPPGSFRSAANVTGLRALVRIPAGAYLGQSELGETAPHAAPRGSASAGGGRVVEVPVAGARSFEALLRPGVRVDVLVTSDRGPGAPRTYLALQRIELADFRAQGQDGSFGQEGGREPDAVAALRVTLPQAVLLTAAQNFARELRLVPRPHRDERRLPATAVAASDLHP
jgi:pilus assembly protein CpaB